MRIQESFIGMREQCQVVRIINAHNMPTVSRKSSGHIFGKGNVGRSFDRDVIVVVDPAQIGQFKMSCQRRRLTADSLHHVAVAA